MSILNTDTAAHNHPLQFGPEVSMLLGDCYEDDDGAELSFSLAESLLAAGNNGAQAAMSVFMELVMGRSVERHTKAAGREPRNIRSKALGANFVATSTSDIIRGRAHIICQSDNVYYVRADLYCASGLVASGTALWSIDA